MIEIVINYNPQTKEYTAYEPTTDTIFITSSLGESFLKLDEFLKARGMITVDILASLDIMYHIDSYVFLGLIENNINLMRRLNQAPSGFMISSQKLGISNQGSGKQKYDNKKFGKSTGTFSKSSFSGSEKKFGRKN